MNHESLPAPKLSLCLTSHPDQLSLAVPPFVGAVSTGDAYDTTREEWKLSWCWQTRVSRLEVTQGHQTWYHVLAMVYYQCATV